MPARRRRRESATQRRQRIHEAALRRRDQAIRADLPVRRQINDAVTERFGGERAVIGEMERRIPSFYENYRREVQAAAERQRMAFAQATASIQQQAQQGFQQSTQQNQQMFGQMQADAQSRGAQVDPALQQQALQAAQARQANMQQFGNLLQGQGANFDALFANTGVVAAGQQLQAQEQEANRRRSLERDIGVFRRQERGRIGEAQQKQRLEEALFGIKLEDTRADNERADADLNRRSRADRSRARRERERNRRQGVPTGFSSLEEFQRYRDEHVGHGHNVSATGGHTIPGRGRGGSGSDGPSEFTPTQRREGRRKFREAVGLIRSTPAARQYLRPGGGARLRRDLVGKGYDPLIARAATERAIYGGVWASTARQLRREYGFNVRVYRPNRSRNAPGANGQRRPT